MHNQAVFGPNSSSKRENSKTDFFSFDVVTTHNDQTGAFYAFLTLFVPGARGLPWELMNMAERPFRQGMGGSHTHILSKSGQLSPLFCPPACLGFPLWLHCRPVVLVDKTRQHK